MTQNGAAPFAAAQAHRNRAPSAAGLAQAHGSPYTPRHPDPSPLERPAHDHLLAAPAFGSPLIRISHQQRQQQQASGEDQAFMFRGGEYAGEMPSYVSGMGAANEEKQPATGRKGVSMRIRRPKTVSKKKAAQRRKSIGAQTPTSTRKALKKELRGLAAEQAEAERLAVVATPRATPKSMKKARGEHVFAGQCCAICRTILDYLAVIRCV